MDHTFQKQKHHHQSPGNTANSNNDNGLLNLSTAVLSDDYESTMAFLRQQDSNMMTSFLSSLQMSPSIESKLPLQVIYEQYEELEKAKQAITRRLAEMEMEKRSSTFSLQSSFLSPSSAVPAQHDHKLPATRADATIKKSPATIPIGPLAVSTSPPNRTPRALKPLLSSPYLNPNGAEHVLATKSNYQNVREGKAAALGLDFSSNLKVGIEVRRTAHKTAEQKRRDVLNEWFERLRQEVEDGYLSKYAMTAQSEEEDPHELQKALELLPGTAQKKQPISKVLLLKYAYEYIATLKEVIGERNERIEELERRMLSRNT